MSEKLVFVGVIPDVAVIGPDEQIVWISNAGHLKIEFDPTRPLLLISESGVGYRLSHGSGGSLQGQDEITSESEIDRLL